MNGNESTYTARTSILKLLTLERPPVGEKLGLARLNTLNYYHFSIFLGCSCLFEPGSIWLRGTRVLK